MVKRQFYIAYMLGGEVSVHREYCSYLDDAVETRLIGKLFNIDEALIVASVHTAKKLKICKRCLLV